MFCIIIKSIQDFGKYILVEYHQWYHGSLLWIYLGEPPFTNGRISSLESLLNPRLGWKVVTSSSLEHLIEPNVCGRVVYFSISSQLLISLFDTIKSITLLYISLRDLYASFFELKTFVGQFFCRNVS